MFERGDVIVGQRCCELIAPGERRMVSRTSSSSVPRRAILLAEVRRPTFAEPARMFQTSS
ncbi:hypothetical protein ELH84_30410 (plasmid) [Rhizobium ruizarguesonis]|nr:hypothetical protein ELH84_30410 [Rhizobium ruizarguesonis]